MERKQVFNLLKPACIHLLQTVSALPQRPNTKREVVHSLENLQQALRQVASSTPQLLDASLAEFIFVPISHVLRASRIVPVRALELCLECISILLATGWKREMSPELSGQLLILFTFLANPSSAENGLPATSEELQAAAFKCMAELITNTSRFPEGEQLLTQTSNIPTLGKAVLVMVDSLNDVSSTDVRLQALGAIQALGSSIGDLDALASFLPRMISSLTKLLTVNSSNRVHFRVLERALFTMETVLLRTLNDQATKALPTQATQTESDKTVRTESWLSATAGQVKIALAQVLKLRTHDKEEVRLALLQLCLSIIRDCRTSLSDCTTMVIETLVTLARGGTYPVENDLRILIASDQRLAELLRESLHGWVISLPRLMQSKDDTGRRQIIQQVSVALRLLNDEEIELGMVDDLLAANLRDSVSTIFKGSGDIASVVETVPATEKTLISGNSGALTFRPLSLRLKGQDTMMEEYKVLLGEVAKSKSALAVAQDLVNSVEHGREEMQSASYWLSVRLMQNILQENTAIDDFLDVGSSATQDEIVDQLYGIALRRLTTGTDETTHWHMQALSLEIIALQAQRYKTEFRVELIETLYPVLHYLASPNPGLQNHAMVCLNIIATECGYTSASDLVVSNVDYIVNAVGLKLNYHDISPQAPQVLLMMMRLCGPTLLPFLDDLVGSIFSALERYHGYPKLVELLFSVLKGMAEEGVKAPQLTIEAGGEDTTQHPSGAWKPESMAEVIEAIIQLKAESAKKDDEHTQFTESFPHRPWKDLDKKDADTTDNHAEEEQLSQEPAPAPDAEPPPPTPKTFTILLKISELTQHYLTSSSPTLRSSLLSLLNTTIPALARHENSFLPLINTLWPVLLPRLRDPEAYVVSSALEIIAAMCTHAGDFMRSRIEGIWGDLSAIHRQTLTKNNVWEGRGRDISKPINLQIPRGSDSNSNSDSLSLTSPHSIGAAVREPSYRPLTYVEAPTRMIRGSLIGLLCAVARHVTIKEGLFDDLVDKLDPVLMERSDVREALESRNPDAVWLRLYRKYKSGAYATSGGVLGAFAKVRMPVGSSRYGFVQV